MKVRILKHCKIHGSPAAPGEIHDVHEVRAKALTDNEYAEASEGVHDVSESSDSDPLVERIQQ